MSTLRRIQSSRENGKLSHGPTTDAGKQASATNSLRHGMLAQTVVLTGESKDRFITLLQALVDEYNPVTESETSLVESMAVARWRQMRVWGIEKSGFDREMARLPGPAPVRAAIAFKNLSDSSRSLDLILRYEARFERQFQQALKNLLLRQASRPETIEFCDTMISLASATWEDEIEPFKLELPDEPNPTSEHPPSGT